uniref:Uncharacterized protein n=1 Tax=Caudovirales sp. ctrNG92 TaxID=2827638 RepID=A0A8S5SE78_9CAUD|nr:MAG TPA: hypothetical protein [Caudovirales sp. ctrNG92]
MCIIIITSRLLTVSTHSPAPLGGVVSGQKGHHHV